MNLQMDFIVEPMELDSGGGGCTAKVDVCICDDRCICNDLDCFIDF